MVKPGKPEKVVSQPRSTLRTLVSGWWGALGIHACVDWIGNSGDFQIFHLGVSLDVALRAELWLGWALRHPPASVTAPETPVSFSGSHREEPRGGLERGGADVGGTGVAAVCTCLVVWMSLVLGCSRFLKDAFWEAPGVGRAGGPCKEGSPLPTGTFHGPGSLSFSCQNSGQWRPCAAPCRHLPGST